MKASAFAILLTALLMRPTSCDAQAALFWDTQPASGGAQGGSGNWLGTNFWNNVFPGDNIAWIDGTTASFIGTPGTVTVNGPVTANRLNFNVSGYTIGGGSTLTMGGATPNIFVNIVASNTAAISAPIGGSAGFIKAGVGTLTLSGTAANNYTGLATVTEGTLNLSKSGVNALTGNLTIGDGTDQAPASAIVVQGANNQIPDTATVRIERDGFWNLASSNRSETIGALVIYEGSVATGAGALTIGTLAISGGSLATGAGGLMLNGNVEAFSRGDDNDYPDATISGLVNLGGVTRTFSTGPIIAGQIEDLIISAAISNGGLTKSGPNTLTLSGTLANSYTGVTTVQAGELVLNKTAGVNAISGDLMIGIGFELSSARVRQGADNQIADTATVTIKDGNWNLANGNRSEAIAALALTGGSIATGSGTLTINGNVTTSAHANTSTIDGELNLGGATRTFDIADGAAAEDMYVQARISAGGLTKTGPGTMRLNTFNPNSFSGPVALTGGVVSVRDVADSGTGSDLGAGSTILFDGGALTFTGTTDSTNRAVTLNAGGGTVNVTQAAQTLMMAGAFTGAGGLTKTGPGTLTLSGAPANDYAGTTTAADATLNLNKPASVNAIGGNLAIGDGSGAAASAIVVPGADEQIPDTAAVAIAADGFWNLASGNRSETIAALTMTAGSIATGSGTLTVKGNVTTSASATGANISGQLNLGGATRTFDIAEGTAANDLDISAGITNGTAGLTKTGDGTLRISGANAFSGPVTVNAGTLIARNGSAIGDSSDVTLANAGTLSIESSETINSLTGSGSIVLATAGTLTVIGSGSTPFSGSISGAGGFLKIGSGTQTFNAAPTYAGNTHVAVGTLVLNSGIASAAGTMTVTAPGTLQARTTVNRAIAGDGTITATGTLIIGDATSATGFAFNGTLNAGSNSVTLADTDVAQLGVATTLGNGGRLDAPNGTLLASGRTVITGATASAVISSGFTNNGTVHGPTTSGRSLTFLGDVNGTGSYTGNVTFSDGFSPGMSTAAVSLENFTLDATATLSIEIGGLVAGTQYDRLNFTGTGTLDGELSVSLINGFNPQAGNTFTFIQGGTLSGAFAEMNLPPLDPGLAWRYAQTAGAATLTVISTLPVDLRIVSTARLPNGHIVLTCLGAPGLLNRVEAVASLTPLPTAWTTVESLTADPDGNFTFTDTAAPGFPARFYRLAYP